MFNIKPAFRIDEKALENAYYGLSKRLHPDRFAAGGTSVKMKSQEMAAALNQAYLSLRQPESRLETLLKGAGALKDGERSASQNQIPAELAEEYFELQEAVMEDAEKAAQLARSLRERLEIQKQELSAQMYGEAEKLDWSAPAQAHLEKIVDLRRRRSYVRSMLENLERLGVRHV